MNSEIDNLNALLVHFGDLIAQSTRLKAKLAKFKTKLDKVNAQIQQTGAEYEKSVKKLSPLKISLTYQNDRLVCNVVR